MLSDKKVANSLSKLNGPDSQNICGVNLLARKKNININARKVMKEAVGNFAKNVNEKCKNKITEDLNMNQTQYSNVEKVIPDKAKNIRDNIMQFKKAEISKLFNKNAGIKKNEPKMDMIKA